MGSVTTYSPFLTPFSGSTGTGLDQLIAWDGLDGGLAGANEAASIAGGLAAADALNRMLIQGLQALNLLTKEVLTSADMVALNGWVRSDPERLARFIALHGDDEDGDETGFHQIQNDGGNRRFDGRALIDTVQDGLYHFGFPLSADGSRFTNEDGADNALLSDVARWLTALKTDLTSTNTGLDRIVETIVADPGLAATITWPQIKGGATAADGLNSLIVSGINALQQAGAADADPTRLSAGEVRWINSWIRSDSNRYASFVALHGDDENGVETGYHLVQNDGGNTVLFGRNAINTIFDGIYHIGFAIGSDGRFVNEDGNANARVSDVAEWITYYYGDPSTTGSGFDRLTDWMRLDPGLAKWTSATDINDGLAAADGILHLCLDAINATGANNDGWISKNDLRLINGWIRSNHYAQFVALHGDDEGDGTETGFHKIQNDGGSTQFFGRNLINTVADGMFHIGFEIQGENFLNEDGNTNQTLSDVSAWVNYFLNSTRLTVGTDGADVLVGNNERDQLQGKSGNDLMQGNDGSDLLDGGWGNDTLQGGNGVDQLDGGFGDDLLDGGEDGDLYLVSGANPDWVSGVPYSFQGYDSYADSGSGGVDRIVATGTGPVDVGLRGFGPASGIEQIVNASSDGNGGTDLMRLLGNWEANSFDFSATELVGGNVRIDAGGGNDTVVGSAQADAIRGGQGDDRLDGGAAGDTYLVSGAGPERVQGQPYTFEGYDSYADSGSGGVDRIVAVAANGSDAVDIGLRNLGPSSGIEVIDATGTSGRVRLLGNWEANSFDFSATELRGSNLSIELNDGNDLCIGSAAADLVSGGYGNDRISGGGGDDTINGGGGDDVLDGGEGSDTYLVTGLESGGWKSFGGSDTYRDSGSGGTDRIVAIGSDDVDIGLAGGNFLPGSGIEQIVNNTLRTINGVSTAARVRLLGNWDSNTLNFGGVSFLGGGIRIDAGDGNDAVTGSANADQILGGQGNDTLLGGDGNDTLNGGRGDDSLNGGGDSDVYEVSGSVAGGFQGYDSYADSGNAGLDRIVVVSAGGADAVDIGLRGFGPASGIEVIDATATSGSVRLLGDGSANSLDFSGVSLLGSNLLIDLGAGNDSCVGSAAADRILAGTGIDRLDGGGGNDTLQGGAGLDILTGGAGADSFDCNTLSDALIGGTAAAAQFERITDFVIGQDRIDVATPPAPAGLRTLGSVSSLTASAITTLLSTTNFVAGGAATFTYGSRTFLALNNSTAGFNSGTDAVLEISGYSFASGFSSLNQISLV